MKKMKRYWERLSFARQIAAVFMVLCFVQIILLSGISSQYLTKVVEEKILGFFQLTVEQAAMNISATLSGYEDAANQMILDEGFLSDMYKLQAGEEKSELKAKESIRGKFRTFMSYRPDVRWLVVQTENGKSFCSDRLLIDSLYQETSSLHKKYFEQYKGEESGIRRRDWIGAEYYDTQGTSPYYLFTYRKKLFDLYNTKFVGTFLMGINETVLSEICTDAQISHDTNINYNFIINEEECVVTHWDKKMLGKDMKEIPSWTAIISSPLEDHKAVVLDGSKKFVLIEEIPKTSWRMVSVLDNSYILYEIREFHSKVWIISITMMFIMAFSIWIVSKHLSSSVKKIVNTMREVGHGELSVTVNMNSEGKNEITIIAEQFNKMMKKINEQVEEIKISGKKEKDAEIRALENQINPHFIYNTLDSINWLAIENDQDEISEMLSQFALILRYQINKSNEMVSIKEEINYLDKYLYLQKVRFMDNFEYAIDCEESIYEYQIHKMIFQPFIENAIIHGYADIHHGGFLQIQITSTDSENIQFMIRDNGNGMSKQRVEEVFYSNGSNASIGVSNVMTRLELYYGNKYHLNVESQEGKGTVIKIVIPKISGREKVEN